MVRWGWAGAVSETAQGSEVTLSSWDSVFTAHFFSCGEAQVSALYYPSCTSAQLLQTEVSLSSLTAQTGAASWAVVN